MLLGSGCAAYSAQPSAWVQVIKLWYPYLTRREREFLFDEAPSQHTAEEAPRVIDDAYHEEDMIAIQKEFAAMDASGDQTVDRHVRRILASCACCRCRSKCCGPRCWPPAHNVRYGTQEFEKTMLQMWGVTATSKGRKKYVKMVNQWFDEIDTDGSNEIEFEEFKLWYLATISEANAVLEQSASMAALDLR